MTAEAAPVELKRCPFCQSRVDSFFNMHLGTTFYTCRDPGCSAVVSFRGIADHRKAWNTRPENKNALH